MALVSLAAFRRSGLGRGSSKLRAMRILPSVARSGNDVRALYARAVLVCRQYPALGDRNHCASAVAVALDHGDAARTSVAVNQMILTGWLTVSGGHSYRSLRKTIAGLDQITWGMACLLTGLMVSLWKLGVPQACLARWFKPHEKLRS